MNYINHENTDEEIMLLLQKGEKEALSVIYDRYSKKIVNFFYRMLNCDIYKAQDFMHDLFLKIINKPGSFDCSRNFNAWIFSIAHNMCKNEYKKYSVRNEFKNNEILKPGENRAYIEDKIDSRLFKSGLDESLKHLDDNHKTIFLLRFQQDFSIKEISEVLKCPEGTVKSRLFYTLKILSEKLKAFDPATN